VDTSIESLHSFAQAKECLLGFLRPIYLGLALGLLETLSFTIDEVDKGLRKDFLREQEGAIRINEVISINWVPARRT
jgi:hypothetical protein